jgi:uncharacterized protein
MAPGGLVENSVHAQDMAPTLAHIAQGATRPRLARIILLNTRRVQILNLETSQKAKPMKSKKSFQECVDSLRREKDQFFKNDLDSPILPEERPAFRGLVYYPPDPNFSITARLTRLDKLEPVSISTSTGIDQAYLKYGTLSFNIGGVNVQLVVYKSTEDPYAPSMFVPFSDETSGFETYESGRYMDLEESGSDYYELDFNLAYNPYCAYNSQYTCPIPPKENKLPVKILAGEKKYKL